MSAHVYRNSTRTDLLEMVALIETPLTVDARHLALPQPAVAITARVRRLARPRVAAREERHEQRADNGSSHIAWYRARSKNDACASAVAVDSTPGQFVIDARRNTSTRRDLATETRRSNEGIFRLQH